MSRRMIVGIIVAVVLIGGGVAYVATKDNEDSDKNNTNTSQTGSNSGSSTNTFNPASTEGLEFKATLTTTSTSGTTEATIEHDDKGNTQYTATTNGQQVKIIYTSDAYYMCTGDSCIKYPSSQSSNSGFNPSDYTYDQSKLSGYKNGAAYKGQKSCASGTCDVWSVSAGGFTSTIYVDSATKRITQVDSSIGGNSTKIVYDYSDVTITVPANTQTIPTQ